jgi:EAL domain-containing protein (putative c-di-GMP-specific phosphodiesterase class I)
MAAEREQRLTLLNELRSAMTERRGLELYYQPQISFATRRVVGAEALLRWRRDNGEFVPPDRFIALAEYSGLIVELGAWVFETAVAQLAEWDRCALHLQRMSINVSLVQFRAAEFLPMARDCVQRAAMPAGRIELEITESMAMLEADRVGIMLDELKQLGFLIAIDDFGTGFSSLSYLHELPIDRLKIDRAFIRSLSEQARGKSIARMVVGLGHSLGLAVIAEGVETEAQAAILRAMQCDEVQGFLYGKPMPAAQFKDWHAAWLAAPC